MKWLDAMKYMKDGEKVTRESWTDTYLRWDGSSYVYGSRDVPGTVYETPAQPSDSKGIGAYADGWLLFIVPSKKDDGE